MIVKAKELDRETIESQNEADQEAGVDKELLLPYFVDAEDSTGCVRVCVRVCVCVSSFHSLTNPSPPPIHIHTIPDSHRSCLRLVGT